MLHLPSEPAVYLVAWTVTFLVAFGKGAFGGGLAVLSVPGLATVVPPLDAAVATAVLVTFMDLFAIRAFPVRTWSWPDLVPLLLGLICGILVGAAVVSAIDERLVGVLIAVVTLGFVARYFWGGSSDSGPPRPASFPRATFFGALGGFTTFVAHAGGPPIAWYLLPRRLDKSVYAGTNIALFTVGNWVKLVPYVVIGLGRPDAFGLALAAAPAAPIGVWAGKIVHDRFTQRTIYTICYALTGIGGLKLLADAVRAYL